MVEGYGLGDTLPYVESCLECRRPLRPGEVVMPASRKRH